MAALAIVVWHYLDQWKLSYLFPGPFAVTLFFELSGLLITWLLLNELDETGRIDQRQFYLRRSLRLFPVFYVVWALCRLAGPFAGSWAHFFYLGDYYTAVTHRYSYLTQAWSLGVEEKFYLIWPLLLARVERQRLTRLLVGVLVFEPIHRFVLVSLGHREYTWFAFDCRLDPIALGCLIAIAVRGGWVAPRWMSHSLTPVGALVGVVLFQRFPDLATYLLAVVLVSVICRPPAFLNHPLVRYFGMISYSLYLCHSYVKEVWWPHLWDGTAAAQPPLPTVFLQLLVAVGLASALHYAVERPFLKLKDRFHPRRSAV